MTALEPAAFWRLADAFLATRENANTRGAYARDLAALGAALGAPERLAEPPLIDVDTDDEARRAAEALAALPVEWWQSWRDALDGSLASRRRRVAGVRAFCRWWSRLLALENPVEDLRPPAAGEVGDAPKREFVALAPAEVRRLIDAAARPGVLGVRDVTLIEVLYGCGLRASEAAGLSLSACHLDDVGDPYVTIAGKGGRVRAVAVPRAARDALAAYLRTARPELRARDRHPREARHGDADAVFLSTRGRRLGRDGVWRVVAGAADRAGLREDGRRIFPHALRHSCGTHLIQSGVDIRYVQAHLGHASPVTTEVYTHVSAAHLRDDFDRAHPRARRGGHDVRAPSG